MFKCEHKVVRKFALETQKLTHSLCPIDRANKFNFIAKNSKFNSHVHCLDLTTYSYQNRQDQIGGNKQTKSVHSKHVQNSYCIDMYKQVFETCIRQDSPVDFLEHPRCSKKHPDLHKVKKCCTQHVLPTEFPTETVKKDPKTSSLTNKCSMV